MIVYMLLLLLIAFFAYGIGGLSTMILASNFVFRRGLWKLGKGNVWISNFRRVFGVKGFIKLLLTEVIKDILPILLGGLLLGAKGHADVGRAFAGFCLVMGRLFPVYYDLKGSHASICLIVMGIVINPAMGVVAALFVIAGTFITKYLTLGALAGAVALVASSILIMGGNTIVQLLCAFTAGAVIIKHIPAIARIISHSEEKLSFEQDLSWKFDQ